MARINANGVNLEYEFHGVRDNPVIALVHGLGMPMTAWPEKMIDLLVDAGFSVLRYDNRDTGKSDKFDHLPFPNLPWHFLQVKLGLRPKPPYPLAHLMDDAIALLDRLDIERAHVVGVSMGGMVAQLMAINAPERCKSLTSIMSTTGNRNLPGPEKHISQHLMSKPASNSPGDIMAFHVKTWQLIGSPAYPTEQKTLEKMIAKNLDHGMSTMGTFRQMLAIMSTPSRVDQLRKLTVPTLVIHGKEDPLVKFEAGLETAKSIPNARLHAIEGMGHSLPDQLLDEIAGQIIVHTKEFEKHK